MTVRSVIDRNRSNQGIQTPISFTDGSHGISVTISSYGGGAIGTIMLPLPIQISDAYNVIIATPQLGFMGGVARDITSGENPITALEALGSDLRDVGADLVDSSAGNERAPIQSAYDVLRYISRSGASFISSSVESGMSSASGVAVNPHVALVFEGVNLKQFNMTWNFAPESRKEMNDITAAITALKKAMLPKYKGAGGGSVPRGLFDYPDLVQLNYKGLSIGDYYTFKPAMINSLTVDYSPNGNVLIRDGGESVPSFVNLSVGFTESQIWTKEDFGG